MVQLSNFWLPRQLPPQYSSNQEDCPCCTPTRWPFKFSEHLYVMCTLPRSALPPQSASRMSDQTMGNLIFTHEMPNFRWFKEIQIRGRLPQTDVKLVTIPRDVIMIRHFKSDSSKQQSWLKVSVWDQCHKEILCPFKSCYWLPSFQPGPATIASKQKKLKLLK